MGKLLESFSNNTIEGPHNDKLKHHWKLNNMDSDDLLKDSKGNMHIKALFKDRIEVTSGPGLNGLRMNGNLDRRYNELQFQNISELPNTVKFDKDFTVSFWMKHNNDGGALSNSPIINLSYGNHNKNIIAILDNNMLIAGSFRDTQYGGKGMNLIRSYTPLTKGRWYHIVYTNNGLQNPVLYINGQKNDLPTSSTYPIYSHPSISPIISPANQRKNTYNGILSDIRIYNTTFSDNDVNSLFRLYNTYGTSVLGDAYEVLNNEILVNEEQMTQRGSIHASATASIDGLNQQLSAAESENNMLINLVHQNEYQHQDIDIPTNDSSLEAFTATNDSSLEAFTTSQYYNKDHNNCIIIIMLFIMIMTIYFMKK
jgi:hypothetical protein